jgi:hypothetical protein
MHHNSTIEVSVRVSEWVIEKISSEPVGQLTKPPWLKRMMGWMHVPARHRYRHVLPRKKREHACSDRCTPGQPLTLLRWLSYLYLVPMSSSHFVPPLLCWCAQPIPQALWISDQPRRAANAGLHAQPRSKRNQPHSFEAERPEYALPGPVGRLFQLHYCCQHFSFSFFGPETALIQNNGCTNYIEDIG